MQQKFILGVFGSLLGLIPAAAVYWYVQQMPAGTSFESLQDLRQQMLATNPPRGSEATLRDIINPDSSDKIIYQLRPHLATTFQGVPVTTNSCGMRDVERSLSKPPGVYRIALLGDSFAFGWGVLQEETFAAVLERTLNRLASSSDGSPAVKFEVLNFGVPGYSTFQEVSQFLETGIDFSPDEVLVFFIENDFGLPFFVRNIESTGQVMAADKFARISERAVDNDVARQREELLSADPNTALRELLLTTRERGIKVSLAINPKKNLPELKRRLPVLREFPEIRSIEMRDSFMEYVERKQIPVPDLTLPTDPHPSALRHKIYGELLATYFFDAL